MNPDQHPSLDEQMAEAIRLQREHVVASHYVDRSGWTRQQWVDDARKQMEDLHGSILDLVNGHVVYLLKEIDYLRAQLISDSPAAAGSQPTTAGEPFRVEAVCRPDSPVAHDLKTWPQFFSAVAANEKRFELRRNDRDFRVGDVLHLEEYDPSKDEYTGRACARRVAHVLPGGQFGIEPGFVVMSLEVVDDNGQPPPEWHRIAVKLGQRHSDWQLLSTAEADALRVEVDAVWDREAIAEDSRLERIADAMGGGECA